MSYGQGQFVGGNALGGIEVERQAKVKAYNDACHANAPTPPRPAPNDPASLRGQAQALFMLCDRLNSQRNRLREIADAVLGPEGEEVAGNGPSQIAPVGGVTADIVSGFETAARLASEIDYQITRLARVAS